MTRAAPGYVEVINESTGIITLHYCGSNLPRLGYWKDANGLYLRGYLWEVERTNSCLYSQDLSNWTKNNAGDTLDISTQLAPDNIHYMQGIIANSTSTQHHFFKTVTAVSGQTYCYYYFVKKGNKSWVDLATYNPTDGARESFFNLDALMWGSDSGGGWLSKGYIDCGNGIIQLWGVNVQNNTNVTLYCTPANSNGVIAFSGDGLTVNDYFWGMQLVQGTYPSSTILTTSSPAIRSADTGLQMAGGANLGTEDLGRGVHIVDFIMRGKPTAARSLVEISDGGDSADMIKMNFDTDGYLNASSAASGGNAGSVQIANNFCDNQLYRAALIYKENHLNIAIKNLATGAISMGTPDVSCDMPDALDRVCWKPLEYGLIGRRFKHIPAFEKSLGEVFR